MLRKLPLYVFCLLSFLYAEKAQVQNLLPDTTVYRLSLDQAIRKYMIRMETTAHLYKGTEYTRIYQGTTGHPFFEWNNFRPGSVCYDGTVYPFVSIAYDLANDEVLISAYQNIRLNLYRDKIDSFSISGHRFMRLAPDSLHAPSLAGGFYEVLYDGPLTVLAKRSKQAIRSFRAEDPYQFVPYNRYLIKKNNAYYEVDNTSSLLSLFDKQKDDIRKYLRQNRFNFKKDPEQTIIRAVDYFKQLNNQ